jgi:dipeptidyl aminopeptidase/acylaminoacyl peptidase
MPPTVDTNNIGLWGSSFGGGNALKAGSEDPRVKAIVCQIGSIDTYTNWINRHPQYRGQKEINDLAVAQSHGSVFPWTIDPPYGLDGAPNLPKIVNEHRPVDAARTINVPTLILAAQDEELFPNAENSEKVYHILKQRGVVTAIDYMPGKHYDAYNPKTGFAKGCPAAIDWFKTHLNASTAKL